MAIKDPRQYSRKINICVKGFTDDGFGGQISSDIFVKSIWAKIATNAGNKFVNFGIQDFKNPVIFSVRGRKNLFEYTENHFVKYKDKELYIKGTEDKGLEEMEFNLYCDEK